MFFLNLDFGAMLPTALLGTLFALVALLALLFILHLCGIRLLWQKCPPVRREKSKDLSPVTEIHDENEIPDEELIAILTAAAVTALGGTDTKRFRVVAFRRL